MRCGQNGIWILSIEFSNSDVCEGQADKEMKKRVWVRTVGPVREIILSKGWRALNGFQETLWEFCGNADPMWPNPRIFQKLEIEFLGEISQLLSLGLLRRIFCQNILCQGFPCGSLHVIRRHGFNPWSGRSSHAMERLSLCATTTTEPAL